MKTLLVMRHGKSAWQDMSLDDFDRPLKKRGEKASRVIGQEIVRRKLVPGLIISSAAERARQTAELTANAAAYTGEIVTSEQLYMSGAKEYVNTIARADDAVDCVLVIGHNPDLENLVFHVTREFVTLPTAALAHIEFDMDRWKDIKHTPGKLLAVLLPRDLMPPEE